METKQEINSSRTSVMQIMPSNCSDINGEIAQEFSFKVHQKLSQFLPFENISEGELRTSSNSSNTYNDKVNNEMSRCIDTSQLFEIYHSVSKTSSGNQSELYLKTGFPLQSFSFQQNLGPVFENLQTSALGNKININRDLKEASDKTDFRGEASSIEDCQKVKGTSELSIFGDNYIQKDLSPNNDSEQNVRNSRSQNENDFQTSTSSFSKIETFHFGNAFAASLKEVHKQQKHSVGDTVNINPILDNSRKALTCTMGLFAPRNENCFNVNYQDKSCALNVFNFVNEFKKIKRDVHVDSPANGPTSSSDVSNTHTGNLIFRNERTGKKGIPEKNIFSNNATWAVFTKNENINLSSEHGQPGSASSINTFNFTDAYISTIKDTSKGKNIHFLSKDGVFKSSGDKNENSQESASTSGGTNTNSNGIFSFVSQGSWMNQETKSMGSIQKSELKFEESLNSFLREIKNQIQPADNLKGGPPFMLSSPQGSLPKHRSTSKLKSNRYLLINSPLARGTLRRGCRTFAGTKRALEDCDLDTSLSDTLRKKLKVNEEYVDQEDNVSPLQTFPFRSRFSGDCNMKNSSRKNVLSHYRKVSLTTNVVGNRGSIFSMAVTRIFTNEQGKE